MITLELAKTKFKKISDNEIKSLKLGEISITDLIKEKLQGSQSILKNKISNKDLEMLLLYAPINKMDINLLSYIVRRYTMSINSGIVIYCLDSADTRFISAFYNILSDIDKNYIQANKRLDNTVGYIILDKILKKLESENLDNNVIETLIKCLGILKNISVANLFYINNTTEEIKELFVFSKEKITKLFELLNKSYTNTEILQSDNKEYIYKLLRQYVNVSDMFRLAFPKEFMQLIINKDTPFLLFSQLPYLENKDKIKLFEKLVIKAFMEKGNNNDVLLLELNDYLNKNEDVIFTDSLERIEFVIMLLDNKHYIKNRHSFISTDILEYYNNYFTVLLSKKDSYTLLENTNDKFNNKVIKLVVDKDIQPKLVNAILSQFNSVNPMISTVGLINPLLEMCTKMYNNLIINNKVKEKEKLRVIVDNYIKICDELLDVIEVLGGYLSIKNNIYNEIYKICTDIYKQEIFKDFLDKHIDKMQKIELQFQKIRKTREEKLLRFIASEYSGLAHNSVKWEL